ncbi:tRNA pseudouridine(38-40) synthase TruA [Parvularcula sp. ZS-1/3]|uniref:tRNA pseudouridine synthase A n=1 Tax=Parvularcula mediterranea TaxID=2732508 RepID=A0A7Y3RLC3_9PROT|nr:tRNA pseudouridine(38-40) synthase TruA [Parvularcula mediterranea]
MERPFWRYRLEIEYDGGPFAGWQRQTNALSVQQVIEDAAAKFTQGTAHCYGAGRTDTGVHARAMTAHLDLPKEVDPFTVQNALNALIRPHPVAILSAEEVSEDFHARFSAKERQYLYRYVTRRAPLALEAGKAWQVPYALDAEAMAEAAQHLVGKHDFTTFRSSHCQSKSPHKSITEINVTQDEERIDLFLRAPSFLHNQVRSIAGTLDRVGAGRWSADDVKDALEATDRTRCGPVAPAEGLYFLKAVY